MVQCAPTRRARTYVRLNGSTNMPYGKPGQEPSQDSRDRKNEHYATNESAFATTMQPQQQMQAIKAQGKETGPARPASSGKAIAIYAVSVLLVVLPMLESRLMHSTATHVRTWDGGKTRACKQKKKREKKTGRNKGAVHSPRQTRRVGPEVDTVAAAT